jgi:hypothetical protein
MEEKEYNSAQKEISNKYINNFEDDFSELVWENNTEIPEAK